MDRDFESLEQLAAALTAELPPEKNTRKQAKDLLDAARSAVLQKGPDFHLRAGDDNNFTPQSDKKAGTPVFEFDPDANTFTVALRAAENRIKLSLSPRGEDHDSIEVTSGSGQRLAWFNFQDGLDGNKHYFRVAVSAAQEALQDLTIES